MLCFAWALSRAHKGKVLGGGEGVGLELEKTRRDERDTRVWWGLNQLKVERNVTLTFGFDACVGVWRACIRMVLKRVGGIHVLVVCVYDFFDVNKCVRHGVRCSAVRLYEHMQS